MLPLLRRIEALEATQPIKVEPGSYVAIRVQSARAGAAPWSDDRVTGATCYGEETARLPGEDVAALCTRIALAQPDGGAGYTIMTLVTHPAAEQAANEQR